MVGFCSRDKGILIVALLASLFIWLLVWWRNRTVRQDGDTGQIHISQITKIRVDLREEDESVSLYDSNGGRLAYFDEELLPWPYSDWAERFGRVYPHIQIDVLE